MLQLHFLNTTEVDDSNRVLFQQIAKDIRKIVFQDGQGVPTERDFDEHDSKATHFLAFVRGSQMGTPNLNFVATARVIRDNDGFKIGRVAVLPLYRKQQVGAVLMRHILDSFSWTTSPITLNAQADPDKDQDVVGFYEKLGFIPDGEKFEQAGIMHLPMLYP